MNVLERLTDVKKSVPAKVIAVLVSVAMVLSLTNISAFAEGNGYEGEIAPVEQSVAVEITVKAEHATVSMGAQSVSNNPGGKTVVVESKQPLSFTAIAQDATYKLETVEAIAVDENGVEKTTQLIANADGKYLIPENQITSDLVISAKATLIDGQNTTTLDSGTVVDPANNANDQASTDKSDTSADRVDQNTLTSETNNEQGSNPSQEIIQDDSLGFEFGDEDNAAGDNTEEIIDAGEAEISEQPGILGQVGDFFSGLFAGTSTLANIINGGSGTSNDPWIINADPGTTITVSSNTSGEKTWDFVSGKNKGSLSSKSKKDVKLNIDKSASGSITIKHLLKDNLLFDKYEYFQINITQKATITFSANGGQDAPVALTAKNGETVTLPDQGSMRKSGSTFMGWGEQPNTAGSNTASDGNVVIYPAGYQWTVNNSKTFYAIWAEAKSGVQYYVRLDGEFPNEPNSSVKTSDYTDKSNNMMGSVKYNTFFAATSGDGVLSHLDQIPSSANIMASVNVKVDAGKTVKFTNGEIYQKCYSATEFEQKYYVLWYVVKPQSDGIHVDGVLLKRDLYNVTYLRGDESVTGDLPSGKQYAKDSNVTVEPQGNLSRSGYTFTGWKTDDGTIYQPGATFSMPTKNVNLTAQWTPNDQTQYKVEHYIPNNDSTGYTLRETETLSGKTDTSVTAQSKNYPGYKVDETNTNNVLNGTIAGNGSLTLKVYYVKDETQKHSISAQVEYYFGDNLDAAKAKTRADATDEVKTEEGWIGADTTVTVEPNTTNKFVGYTHSTTEGDLNYTVKAEAATDATTHVVKVYYVKDETQTQSTSYTIHYFLDDVEQTNDAVTVNSTAWVNDNPAQIAITEDGITAPADKYANYTPHAVKNAEQNWPEAGDMVQSGSEYNVYYVLDRVSTDPVNPDSSDGVPDMYQARVNFAAVNGSVNIPFTYVTLYDADGNYAVDGTGYLTANQIATATAAEGYDQDSLAWDVVPTTENAITGEVTYTVTFTANQTPGVVPVPGDGGTPAPAPAGPVPGAAPAALAPVAAALAAPVAALIGDEPTPLAEEAIGDEEDPLAAFDHVNCWVHYYMILGILLTLVYGGCVIARRSNYSRKIQKMDDYATGKAMDTVEETENVANAAAQKMEA